VVAYERGQRVPPPAIVKRLARVLGYPFSFFGRPELEPIPEDTASFRALSRMKAAQRERALAGAELALELNEWLEARFEMPSLDLPDLHPQPNPEAAAVALRARW